jgi:hypothetical protein
MNSRWSRYLFPALVWIALIGLGGCASGGIAARTMSWQEEVLLHDGRIAIAERFYNLGGYSTLASTERSAVTQTVTFTLPGANQRIVWQTDFRDTVPEANSLNMLLFDVVNGIPYIATYPAGCIAYNKWQRPNPPYVLFKHEQGGWKRISMAEFPAELKKTNVSVGRPAAGLLKSYYTVEGINERNYYLEPKYKAILREAVANEGSSCIKSDFYGKAGWLSPDWFTRQPSLEACLQFCGRREIEADICPCKTIFLRK